MMASSALKNSWIPSTPSLCYDFYWKLTTSDETKGTLIVSDFIGIPDILTQAFRLCAETNKDNDVIQLSCYVNNIGFGQMGYKMTAVTVTPEIGNTIRELDKVGNSSESSALFRWDASKDQLIETNGDSSMLTVRLYYCGSVGHNALCRVDINHGQDLWNAAVYSDMTDVIFQVLDKTFAAHKFILAARSPVFRAMFDNDMFESRTGEVHIVDVEDPDIFEQFLHFLYTGQLVKPMTQKLGTLAEKYQVETLASIFHEANDNEAAFRYEGLVLSVATSNDLRKGSKRISRVGQVDQTFRGMLYYVEMCLVENAVQYVDKGPRWVHDKAFLLKLDSSSNGSTTTFALYSSWTNEPARKLFGVDLFVCKKDVVCKRAAMGCVLAEKDSDKQPLEVFSTTLRNVVFQDPDMSYRFLIHRSSTLEDYEYGLRDSLLAQELWSSAVDKRWTDVEFRVGGKTFPAHRALLAARCPTLADLVPGESSPLSPGIVQIGTVDPSTFEDLLYFLYTGSIRKDSPDESLLEAAKSYHVETLEMVGKESGRRKQMDQDEISQAIFLLH